MTTKDQEDATVTLDELRALLLVLREPEDATPRTAKERAWNRALDAVLEAASRYVRDALSVEGREADREAGIEAIRDADTAVPEPSDPGAITCARYFGSDGTVCATHHGHFLSSATANCDKAVMAILAATQGHRPPCRWANTVGDLPPIGEDGCTCLTAVPDSRETPERRERVDPDLLAVPVALIGEHEPGPDVPLAPDEEERLRAIAGEGYLWADHDVQRLLATLDFVRRDRNLLWERSNDDGLGNAGADPLVRRDDAGGRVLDGSSLEVGDHPPSERVDPDLRADDLAALCEHVLANHGPCQMAASLAATEGPRDLSGVKHDPAECADCARIKGVVIAPHDLACGRSPGQPDPLCAACAATDAATPDHTEGGEEPT